MVLDHPQLRWLGSHLDRLKSGKNPKAPIWPFDREAFSRAFAAAVSAVGIKEWGVVLYSLRHSGPSWDRATKRLSLAEIQRRGRWLSEKTVIRYERSARTLALLSEQPQVFLVYLRRCAKSLQAFVEGGAPMPKPPLRSVATSS